MKKHIVLSLFCFCMQTAFTQELPLSKLNKYFDALEQNNAFMGSVRVSRAGKDIYTKSVGFANVKDKIKMTPEAAHKIGSISKTMTAVLVFQAIEQGNLKLSTTLDKNFPTIKNAQQITINHLLSHSSGIAQQDFTNIETDITSWFSKPKSRVDLLNTINDAASDLAPGRVEYNNLNYILLSFILEDIYNKPFNEIFNKGIVAPLNLTDTFFGKPKQNSTCSSYIYTDQWTLSYDTHPSIFVGAGGIISTTKDMNTFFQALFNGKLISQSSLTEMKTMEKGLGKGLMRTPFGNKVGYGHGGKIDGFNTITCYFPDDKTVYSLVSNGTNFVINDISIAVLSAIYNVPFEIPNFNSKAKDLSSVDLDKYLGVYASKQLPIKLTVTKQNNILVAQGTGQAAFNLVAFENHTFKYDLAKIILIFDPIKETMILKQGGVNYMMKRE